MQQQWQNGKGETVYVSPGQQLPYGSTWQQVGGVSNPMGGGSRVPSPTYQQPTSSSSSSPFGSSTASSPFSVSSSLSHPSSTYSGSGYSGPGISLPPFLDRSQRRAAALDFLIGFVLAYLPFLLRGLGNYSSYPFIVSSATVTFANCHPQVRSSINAVYAITYSAVYYVFRCLLPRTRPPLLG